jgi:hypothetical protein
MSDSYHTIGAQRDRERDRRDRQEVFQQKEREIKAQERIAAALEAIALSSPGSGPSHRDALIRVAANSRAEIDNEEKP